MEKEIDLISQDAIFNRQVHVRQRKRGYRFSIDALLLAWYTSALAGDRAAELGTGSGVVSLALSWQRGNELEIDAVEIQGGLANLARENSRLNTMPNIRIIHQDLKSFPDQDQLGTYDFVYTNPPFRAVGQGRLNPDLEKAIARHELHASLFETLECCHRCLQENGTATMIILAERLDDLKRDSGRSGLKIKQKTWISPFPGREANLLLVSLNKTGSGSMPDAEIAIWEKKDEYTPALTELLNGKWQGLPHPLLNSVNSVEENSD